MKASEYLMEIAAALSKAQGEFPVIPKNRKVDVYSKPPERKFLYSFKYADLTEIISAIRPTLAKNQLSFTQTMVRDENMGEGLVTDIIHSSGQTIRAGFVPLAMGKDADMKDIAGVLTYGKRLSLSQAFGISADEDVDAPSQKDESIVAEDIKRNQPKVIANNSPKPPNRAPTGDILVKALVTYSDKELPKAAGFQWDKTMNVWTKRVSQSELGTFKFKVEEITELDQALR